MGQVLKVVAGLFSTFLLVMTLGGLVGRPANGGARGVLLRNLGVIGYPDWYWVVPGTHLHRPVPYTIVPVSQFQGQSPDLRYYYWYNPVSANVVTFFRVDITTGRVETIAGQPYGAVLFSPNGQWLVSIQIPFERGAPSDIYRARLDGRDYLNLTADFNGTLAITPDALYENWIQISPDSQWVYFTNAKASQPLQIYRVPMAGGAIEQITHEPENFTMQFWPPTSAWPIVRRDNRLYWMRPDGGEFQTVWPTESDDSIVNEQIIGWLPAEEILVVRRDNGPLIAVRQGATEPVWQVEGPYISFIRLDNWLIFYGSAVARMRPDGSEFSELAGQVGSDSASLIGLGVDEPSLIFFRDFPGTANVNYQRVRLSDGAIQAIPVASRVGMNDLLADLDWNSPYLREVMVDLTVTNLQPFRSPAQFPDSDFIAVGPPIDRKWHPIPLILIAGGLLIVALVAPRNKIPRLKNQMSA